MNRSGFAFFVALLIHLLLLMLFWILGTLTPPIKSIEKPKEQKIKISLKEMPKKYKKTGIVKQKVKKTPIAPPMPKGSQLKKIVKKPPLQYKAHKKRKTPHLNKSKITKHEIKKPLKKQTPTHVVKPYIPLEKKKAKQEVKKKSKTSWMYEDKSAQETKAQKRKIAAGGNISQDIKKLYGDEFGKLTKGQQQYIIDNQEIMRRITQQVLTRVARVNLQSNLNVNRTNVIEFYLHPNGDMTDFKFLHKSGYFILDETTKETIEYAYSRYPRPKEKILIRYNVFYNLARY